MEGINLNAVRLSSEKRMKEKIISSLEKNIEILKNIDTGVSIDKLEAYQEVVEFIRLTVI